MRLTTALFAATASLAIATASAADAKTFRWAFQGNLQSLDPHGLFETFTIGTHGGFYEALVRYDKDMNVVPTLAEEYSNPEPSKWVFKLRQGVKFHNGNDFTADDVIFSWKRALSEGSDMKIPAGKIKNITKIDDHTIEIDTGAPNPILPRDLIVLYIMDKEWSEEHNTTSATNVKGGDEGNYANLNANGTGPFEVRSHQAGVRTELVRNSDHWNDDIATNVTEAILTPIGQDATRVAALISGELDMAYPVPVQDWNRLEQAQGVSALTGPEARTIFLGMDQARDELLYSDVKGKNPFKDVRVRKAFAHGINIEAIKDKVMRGSSIPSALLIAPQINGFAPELNDWWEYDPDQSKKLLAEAGYPDGFRVTMDCPNDRYVNDEKICQAVAAMLARVGITVDLLAQPKSKYFAKVLAQNDYDTSFYLLGWTPGTFDAHNALEPLMACRRDGMGQFNLGGYCNEKVTELTKSAESETDRSKRQSMIEEAFRIHKEEVGHIPLHQQPLSWGVREGVELVQRPDNVLDLRYVVIKD